jgi:hypothetical protein
VMLQAIWFDAGDEAPGRLLLTIHHLAVDGVSWRILLPDLAAAWQAVASGAEPMLPTRSTSPDAGRNSWRSKRRMRSVSKSLRSGRTCFASRHWRWSTRARSYPRCQRQGRPANTHAAGCGHRPAADAAARGLPRRHQRCAAHRPGDRDRGLGPAA